MKVGDIVLLKNNDEVPASCVLLKKTNQLQPVFANTNVLDGESNFKVKDVASIHTQHNFEHIVKEQKLRVRVPKLSNESQGLTGEIEFNYRDARSREKSEKFDI